MLRMPVDVRLPVRFTGTRRTGTLKLVTLPVGENGNSHRQEHWRDDQHQDPGAQSLNKAAARRRCLRITERAALRVGSSTHREYQHQDGRSAVPQESRARISRHRTPYFGNARMWRSRKLSDQIIFIMNSTKRVAGIRAHRKLRRSSRRCMKNITARLAWITATMSIRTSN